MLITLLVHYRITELHRMRSASDALFMKRLTLTEANMVSASLLRSGIIHAIYTLASFALSGDN